MINDAIRRQSLLEGVKANEADKFLTFLKRMDADLRNRLSSTDITDYNRARLNALVVDIAKSQRAIIQEYIKDVNDTLDNTAITESVLEAKALNATILTKGFEAVLPTPNQLITAFRNEPLSLRGKGQGLTLEPFLKAYEDDQIALISGRISQGFAEGQTTDQIIKGLRGTKAANFSDGVLSVVDRNTKTMVRTALQNASSMARQKTWEENSDIITGVEWVSTLDDRTTSECQALDGQIFPVDSGPRPPLHYGCRSTTAPVLADDLQYLEQGAKRPAKGEDSDGDMQVKQISAKTTYYEWLQTQPASFQDDIIGPVRGKLLRNGGLTSEEFRALQLNKNFKPITLEEMEKKAPEAFEKANIKL